MHQVLILNYLTPSDKLYWVCIVEERDLSDFAGFVSSLLFGLLFVFARPKLYYFLLSKEISSLFYSSQKDCRYFLQNQIQPKKTFFTRSFTSNRWPP